MPELPEVETVRNGLKRRVLDKVIVEARVIYDGIIEYPKVKDFSKDINKHYLILNGERIEADIAYQEIYKSAQKSICNYVRL